MPYPSYSRAPNYPQQERAPIQQKTYPNDLIAEGRNFYTQIQFVEYNSAFFSDPRVSGAIDSINEFVDDINGAQTGDFITIPPSLPSSGGGVLIPQGGYNLPIPRKVNDQYVLTWNEKDISSFGNAIGGMGRLAQAVRAGRGGVALFPIGSALTGLALNPYLFMVFQRPNFKEFNFQWVFAPRTEEESETVRDIINAFKKASAPTYGQLTFGYPQIALVKMFPNDMFGNLKFKPMAIISTQVDYTGGGQPSFFQGTAAPTIITFSVHMKEIKLWFRDDM